MNAQRAKALFDERCRDSGERIDQVVEGIEGVFLLKIRPGQADRDVQFGLDDPYGRDLSGDGYIASLLKGSYETNVRRPSPCPKCPPIPRGYRYVEALDPSDGLRYRYTGSVQTTTKNGLDGQPFTTSRYVLHKALATGSPPRYGVTYDDISTRLDRTFWIAGSSLRVIDQHTGQVIGERIGYMYDPRQGATNGGRAPWLWAADHACPAFSASREGRAPMSTMQLGQTQRFVEKVLVPVE